MTASKEAGRSGLSLVAAYGNHKPETKTMRDLLLTVAFDLFELAGIACFVAAVLVWLM